MAELIPVLRALYNVIANDEIIDKEDLARQAGELQILSVPKYVKLAPKDRGYGIPLAVYEGE